MAMIASKPPITLRSTRMGEPPTLWRFVSEPPITPLDQNFALRHASVIHAALTPQGNRYWVTFRVFHVTGLQVIGADRDRNRLALIGFYDGQTIKFDFGHHTPTKHCAEQKKKGCRGDDSPKDAATRGVRGRKGWQLSYNSDPTGPFRSPRELKRVHSKEP